MSDQWAGDGIAVWPLDDLRDHSIHDRLYRWHWKARLPERHSQLLRVLVRGSLNSCLIQFVADGHLVITSRHALRKAKQP